MADRSPWVKRAGMVLLLALAVGFGYLRLRGLQENRESRRDAATHAIKTSISTGDYAEAHDAAREFARVSSSLADPSGAFYLQLVEQLEAAAGTPRPGAPTKGSSSNDATSIEGDGQEPTSVANPWDLTIWLVAHGEFAEALAMVEAETARMGDGSHDVMRWKMLGALVEQF